MEMDYTVQSQHSFDDTVEAVVQKTAEAGFKVQFVHDVAATLAEKGFERERVTIVEMCNAKYASKVLAADIKIGLFLPCPIMVFEQGGDVFVSAMKPTMIGAFFADAGVEDVAAEVEGVITRVVDEAAAA